MSLRKEQVLLIATLVLGAWVFNSLRRDEATNYTFRPKAKTLEVTALPPDALAAVEAVAVPSRDWGREPSETQPLPPRALEFPERPPLQLIALPLPCGPDWNWAQLLCISGEVVKDVKLDGGAADAPADAGAGPNAGATAEVQEPTAADKMERYSHQYARVWNTANPKVPLLGVLEYPGGNLFALEDPNFDFSDKQFKLRVFSPKTEKLGSQITLDGKDIQRVRLAENLHNDVERRKAKVGPDITAQRERAELIQWLIDKGREDASIYDDALEQAEKYFKLGNDLQGLQLKAQVLRARGDLGREYQLYQTLPPQFQDTAFQYEGLGQLKQKLGLDREAEQDLRKAVEKAPLQPLPRASLAEFLWHHGQPQRAAAEIERALQAADMVQKAELPGFARIAVGCQLAVGNTDAARATLHRLGDPSPYLLGCVDYAAGNVEAAMASFQQAGGSAEAMPALLGVGACKIRLADWQGAKTAFESVADLAPLLRHRALTGLALLSLRLGDHTAASGYLDRALEAAPGDLYATYLRLRLLRDSGELPAAMEAATEVLRQRDDFVYAVAERAALHVQLARATNDLEQAENFLAAQAYADRAVALAPQPQLELIELQARLHFLAADVRGAEQAFALARQTATSEDDKLFATAGQILCDYQRNRVDDAMVQLERMIRDLPKEHPMRQWAEARKNDIDDHSKKEQLDDRFDRAEPGAVWEPQGLWRPRIEDNRLVFQGQMQKGDDVAVDRAGAVKRGGNFLAVAAQMTVGAGQSADASCGLKIETANANAGAPAQFMAWIGVRDGKPFLRIQDGKEEAVQPELAVPDFDLHKPQRLRFEVVPRAGQQKQFMLQCFWNGVLVHEQQKLTSLQGNTTAPLHTLLFVSGRDSKIDVSFDDYHLERRKEG